MDWYTIDAFSSLIELAIGHFVTKDTENSDLLCAPIVGAIECTQRNS